MDLNAELPELPPEPVVYRRVDVRDSDGNLLGRTTPISADESLLFYAASPSVTLAREPELLRNQQVETFEKSDGTVETRWELSDPKLAESIAPTNNTEPIAVADSVYDAVVRNTDGFLSLLVKVRNVPRWDIWPHAKGRGLDASLEASLEAKRQASLQQRQSAIDVLTHDFRQWAQAAGGTIVSSDLLGWNHVLLPVTEVGDLVSRTDVRAVHAVVEEDDEIDNCIPEPFCSQPNTNWPMGLGRAAERLDLDRFYANGYDGWRSNSGFHNFGRLNVAVMEKRQQGGWEDEARFFKGQWLADRISKRKDCITGNCVYKTNFNDISGTYDHPTSVASIAVGDLQAGQGTSSVMLDPCWDWGHCADWEEMSSGMAPEANLQMWATVDDTNREKAFMDALFDASGTEKPDVINLSTSHKDCEWDEGPTCDSTGCNPASSLIHEDWADVLYLGGVLVVNGSTNNGDTYTGCSLASPGDLATVLTVGAVDADDAACFNGYDIGDCSLRGNSPRGGMPITLGSNTYGGAMTGMDLVAPSEVSHFGIDTFQGSIETNNTFGGTSAAAPHVAGAATILKDWALSNGNTYVNDVGRLHTLMLAMTDRDQGGSAAAKSHADIEWGLGKLKMRLFKSFDYLSPWRYSMRTDTATSTGTKTIVPFSGPMGTGTQLLKCVMQEDEIMYYKSDVGLVNLTVRVVPPTSSGTCPATSSSTGYSRHDSSLDLKHMAAIEPIDTALAGMCVNVDIKRYIVSSSGESTVHVFCYSAGIKDDQP